MDNTVFNAKEADVKPEIVTEKNETESHEVEIPLEGLKKPYVTEILGMGQAYDHFKMKDLSEEIDSFVKSEMARLKVEGKKGYEEIIKDYLSQLKIPEDSDVYTKTEKLISLMRIDKKLLDGIKEKEELLAKDPLEMSPAEFRKLVGRR